MSSVVILILIALLLLSLKLAHRFWVVAFILLAKCWFPLFISSVAAIVFLGTSQGLDIISQTSENEFNGQTFAILGGLWLWSFNSWLVARTVLDLAGTRRLFQRKDKTALLTSAWVPRVIGFIPYLLTIYMLVVVPTQVNGMLMLFIGLQFYYFILYVSVRRKGHFKSGKIFIHAKYVDLLSFYTFPIYRLSGKLINGFFDKVFKREKQKTPVLRVDKYDLKDHWKRSIGGIRAMYLILHILFFAAVAVWPLFWAKSFGPVALVLFALSCYLIISLFIIYIRRLTRLPISVLLILIAVFFTYINDNNTVARINLSSEDDRPSVEQQFNQFIVERSWNTDTIDVNLVAAEGGGIRSAYWTYAVLSQLQKDDPNFASNTFAISSVSGGSVGAGLFCSELDNGLSASVETAPIINEDNLSPMIAGLFYRELIQSIIPYPLEALDRSKISDRAWEKNWGINRSGENYWEKPFLDLNANVNSVPEMLMNTIHVESGSNALFSTMKFDEKQMNSKDMYQLLDNEVKLSTVVGISSRFPYFQPPAKILNADGSSWGHLADGGYYENSGVASAYQLYLLLRELSDQMIKDGVAKEINFSILMIANGELRVDPAQGLMTELKTPMKTLLNSWYTRGYSYSGIAKTTMPKLHTGDGFYEIRLDRKQLAIPVGWYLADKSRDEIKRQASILQKNPDYLLYLNRLKGN